MYKRPAMETPTTNRKKVPRDGLKLRVPEESTARYFSGHTAKTDCLDDSHANKIDKIENLLREAHELACMLLAVRYGATRPAPCEHTLAKRYPSGMRDNNEFDLVCTRCGKSF